MGILEKNPFIHHALYSKMLGLATLYFQRQNPPPRKIAAGVVILQFFQVDDTGEFFDFFNEQVVISPLFGL